ncbi:PQQ-binding-like beta-propeller repeat protein [Halalkalicoccus sp. NIPERK01]|uniref:pyrroloquinoline quinone-dependent dehydrogenase n=1 Tax=Halalkalicoccus sp. NIPERK01 TaxID=3053469 RepID=UPI00256EAEEE|nr:PQQ-binding-like beta-propeller repeat protein [Halalkalicoccus sp. NIPERK01]MDL5362465.1 PQQ-binding-like beta-propeller repeat protein [Halalkalicoccus sp. NIPERK01]
MSIDEDRAVKAAQDTVVRETDNGYRVLGAPEKSVTHQHDIDRIPERDVTQEMLNETAENPESWLTYGGGYEQHRHTTCEVITPENVGDLELEYELSVGAGSSMEGTPLVVPGDPPIMYQTNGPTHMKAIDPREGEILWSYTYAVPNDVVLCCDDNTRGAAVLGDQVFMTTLDSGVVALDRYTGEEQWYTGTADHERGYSATWAPVVYDGTLFTGSAGGEYGVRGFHTALDTDTGDEKWRINVSSEEEWVGDSINQSSTTNWMTATPDPENGRLYMPIGNPGPDFDGSVRPGPNRNSAGTLCLDLETGEELWFHQESPHDVWDYDSAMPRILIRDVEMRGKTRDVVVSVGKTAWQYVLDAETGELLMRSEPLAQQLNMFRMIPHIDEGRRVPFMPGGMGGNDWQPGCYNPELGLTYHKLHNSFQEAWWRFEEFEEGKKYWGGILEDETEAVPEGYNEHISVITAVDPFTGQIAWQDWIDSDIYLWGGTMSTKTGLMFAGNQNGDFVAYDGESGERLWEYDCGEPAISGDPMSWYDPGTEKQYVAVQIGGSGWLRRGKRDDRLVVFSMEE